MAKVFAALLCIALGGGAVLFSCHYHVVQADEGLLLVPRPELEFDDIYVDVRKWDASTWREHPQLVRALVDHGRSDLVVNPTIRDSIRGLLQNFGNAAGESDAARQ